MLTRYLLLTCLTATAAVAAPQAQAGACDPASEAGEHSQRRVDGPANVRVTPNGKVIGSIPNRALVTIIGFQEDRNASIWYQVRWTRGGKTRDGWTHEQNIICD